MTKTYKYNIKVPVDDPDRINKAFITADRITAEANGDGPKWNLYVEGLNPAETRTAKSASCHRLLSRPHQRRHQHQRKTA